MSTPRLDPYNQLIRRIKASTVATEIDRKTAIRMTLEVRALNLPLDKGVTACRGIFAMLQAIHTESQIQEARPGSHEHKNLAIIHARLVDVMNKCFAIITKGSGFKVKNKRAGEMQGRAAMWHPSETQLTGSTVEHTSVGHGARENDANPNADRDGAV